ncbi:MAG TPA: hypothetical protein VJZ00_11575 [Thermoanaerobaculia bacterium]|nr:hypothetical protein [Thermoanaerobaculia bacterium]
MSRIAVGFLFVCCVVANAFAQNVLVNGDFESSGPPALVNGNNINHPAPPWVFGSGNQPNVVQVDGPGGYNYSNNGPESDATHPGAGIPQHYLDIANGSNDFYQSFTPKCDGVVVFGGSFSTRADSSGTATVTLRKGVGTSGAIVGVTNTVTLPAGNSATDPWTPVSYTATMVAGQTYSFVVSMDNNMNFDEGFVRYREACVEDECMKAGIEGVKCGPGGTYTLIANITNTSGHTTQFVVIAPPPGATYTVSPGVVPQVLNPGQSASIPVTISGGTAGQQVCLRFFLQDLEARTCCMVERCFKLPECGCMIATNGVAKCDGPGAYSYTFTLQNNTSVTIQQVFVMPSAGTATPQILPLNLAPGAQTTVTLHLTGVSAGQSLCLLLQAYGTDLKECCVIRVCINKLPPACD